jgi:hypothetical protein
MTEPMSLSEVLWQCFRYFAHADEMNAAMHTAEVRYSPITFRVAEQLGAAFRAGVFVSDPRKPEVAEVLLRKVLDHRGGYAEDPGR